MSNSVKWFKHDINAHSDPAIRQIIYEHGIWAYGVWWVLIELMAGRKDARLEKERLVSMVSSLVQGKLLERDEDEPRGFVSYVDELGNKKDQVDYGRLSIGAGDLQVILWDYLKVGLLKTETEGNTTYVYSESLRERMETYNEIRQKQREGGKKGAEIRKKNEQHRQVSDGGLPDGSPKGNLKVYPQVGSRSTLANRIDQNRIDLSTVHTDPEVRTKHKNTGPSPSLRVEENKKEKSTKEKKPPLPIWDSCEFFRMTSNEYELARVWYLKNNLSEQQLKRAIEAVENWLLIGRTSAAIKARESSNHRPYLYQQWVIEKAQAMVSLTTSKQKNGNGYRAPVNKAQATLDFLKQQYEETLLEEKERTIIDITEVEQ